MTGKNKSAMSTKELKEENGKLQKEVEVLKEKIELLTENLNNMMTFHHLAMSEITTIKKTLISISEKCQRTYLNVIRRPQRTI
jgi:hypothetical protein